MKIAFKDFKRDSKMLGMMAGDLQSSVDAANRWINQEHVDVVNVETHAVHQSNGKFVEDGVRVWFRATR